MGTLVQVALLICHFTVAYTDTCSYEVSLPGIYSYKEVPLPSVNVSNSLVVEIKACKDAILAISNSLDLSKDMFEFAFGAGSNTFCSIRSCKQTCQIVSALDTTLSCTEFRKVWIAWGPPGVRLGVGGKADNNTFLTTTSGASLTVHHVWISMYKTSGDWKVDCTYNETSTLTKSDPATSTTTPTPTPQNTTQSSMQETTSVASSPSANTSRCFCMQVRQSSIVMTAEKIVEELTLKEQTSARRRHLETTSDHRASAQLMGMTAVAVLVTVALAVITPDLIALFVWTTVKLHLVKKHRLGLKTSRLSPEVIGTGKA